MRAGAQATRKSDGAKEAHSSLSLMARARPAAPAAKGAAKAGRGAMSRMQRRQMLCAAPRRSFML